MGRIFREIVEEFYYEDVVKFLKVCEEELDNFFSGFVQFRNFVGYGNKEEYQFIFVIKRKVIKIDKNDKFRINCLELMN